MRRLTADERRRNTLRRQWVGSTASRSVALEPERRGPPLWATGLALALMAVGFKRRNSGQREERHARRAAAEQRLRERSGPEERREAGEQREFRGRREHSEPSA